MFFDMGSTSASATVVSYQEVKEKSKATGIVDKFPQLTIKGVGFVFHVLLYSESKTKPRAKVVL